MSSSTVLASARLFILLQLISRLCTFALSQILLRLTSPQVFGAATIQFELLMGLVLTAAREGVRCVSLREKAQEKDQEKKGQTLAGQQLAVHNLSFLAVGFGLLVDVVLSWLYIRRASPDLRASPYFAPSVVLTALGGAFELLSEPLFNRAQALNLVGLRVRAEGVGVLVNCLLILACILCPQFFGVQRDAAGTFGLVAYGCGRTAMGLAILAVYVLHFARSYGLTALRNLYTPRRAQIDGRSVWFSPAGVGLTWAMGGQALLKHVMGELDKFAVARLGTLEDQGGYALASNYGSLVLRILFNPVEEAARISFSKQLGHVLTEEKKKASDDKDTLGAAAGIMSAILRLHVLLGLFFCTFGPPLAYPVVYLLAGSRWACSTSAPTLLGAYACYIPILGVNGIAEGFLTATAGARQLNQSNRIIIASSVTFVASLLVFRKLGWGETQLVWSSACAMGVRAAYAWWYTVWFFKQAGAQEQAERLLPGAVAPSLPVLLTFAMVAFVLRSVLPLARAPAFCPGSLRAVIPSLAGGAVAALLCLVAW